MAAASRKATRKPSPARRSTSKSAPKAKPKTKAAPKARAARAKAATATGTKAKVKAKAKIRAKAKAKTKPKTAVKKTPAKKASARKAPVKKATARKATAKKTTVKKATVNRRRFDRRDTRIAAKLEHAGGITEGTVTNLSLEGCLFAPRIDLKPNSRIKLYLASEKNSVAATVKAVSDLGVHCLMHAGGATLGRLSTDLDDMALLMLSAGRPHVVAPKAE